jgi:HK97 gp10 family phage protein
MARNRQARKSYDITILGDKKLQRKLSRLRKVVQTPIVRDAMQNALKPVKEMAMRNAPVKTGKLRKSIKVGSYSARGGIIGAAVRTGTRRNLGIQATDSYYYPAAHEYGAPSRGIPARSFMRSAMFAKRTVVLTRFRRFLRLILEK